MEPRPFAAIEDSFFSIRRTLEKTQPLAYPALQQRIREGIARHPAWAGLRDFNRMCVQAAATQLQRPANELCVLDIGASVHGFALEAAVDAGFRNYVGIDLAIRHTWKQPVVAVRHEHGSSLLAQMDAHCLWFEDASFDVAICLSGFEHYLFPEGVIRELLRVLRPGGLGLVTYEPIWTCSYGHHLHHFGLGYDQVPPWAHLLRDEVQFARELRSAPWPAECPVTREQAAEWTYRGRDINRRDVRFHAAMLREAQLPNLVWQMRIPDESPAAVAAAPAAAAALGYSTEELLTRGFSVCFRK